MFGVVRFLLRLPGSLPVVEGLAVEGLAVEGLAVEGMLVLLPSPPQAVPDFLGKPILQLRRPLLLPCPVWSHTTIN